MSRTQNLMGMLTMCIAACGDGAGEGVRESQGELEGVQKADVANSTPWSEVTPEQTRDLCLEFWSWVVATEKDEVLRRSTCTLNGVQSERDCEQVRDACLSSENPDAEISPEDSPCRVRPPPNCPDVTVGQWRDCLGDTVVAAKARAMEVSCDTAPEAIPEAEAPPSCERVHERCPALGLSED